MYIHSPVARTFFLHIALAHSHLHIFMRVHTRMAQGHEKGSLRVCPTSPSRLLRSHVSPVFAVPARSLLPVLKAQDMRTSARAPRSLATWPRGLTFWFRWCHSVYVRSASAIMKPIRPIGFFNRNGKSPRRQHTSGATHTTHQEHTNHVKCKVLPRVLEIRPLTTPFLFRGVLIVCRRTTRQLSLVEAVADPLPPLCFHLSRLFFILRASGYPAGFLFHFRAVLIELLKQRFLFALSLILFVEFLQFYIAVPAAFTGAGSVHLGGAALIRGGLSSFPHANLTLQSRLRWTGIN